MPPEFRLKVSHTRFNPNAYVCLLSPKRSRNNVAGVFMILETSALTTGARNANKITIRSSICFAGTHCTVSSSVNGFVVRDL